MLAYTDLRTGFRPFFRRARDARLAGPVMFTAQNSAFADAGEPAAFPPARVPARTVAEAVTAPAVALAPTPDARLLRRLRHVVRRRVKVELDGLVRASVSDGEIDIHVNTVSARDPKIVEWS